MTYFPIFRLSIQGMKRRNLEEGHCKNLWKSVSIPLSKVPAYIYQGTAAAAAAAAKSLQSCPALCDPIDGSPPGSPVPGVLQARTLEWVASSFPNAGDIRDMSSIPGSGRSPGESHGNPLQYSCLENPRDRGAWWAAVYGVTQSQTWLKHLNSSNLPGNG